MEQIHNLVAKFKRDYRKYKDADAFKETDVRTEFINPFFQALGWDVDNSFCPLPMAFKDVVQEQRVRVKGGSHDENRKAPDYAFRIGGKTAFYVEAKHPRINLDTHKDSAFQVRRYGWSNDLPVSVLTDFEELAIYDTRIQPVYGNEAHVGRLQKLPYLTLEEYESRFKELWDLLSREAVKDGAIERLREEARTQHGTQTVDKVFLRDLESWRVLLAEDIVQNGARLTTAELNDLVLLLLNRIMFLRIAEDRGFEEYGSLRTIQSHSHIWEQLQVLFQRSDERYDSGLFGSSYASLTARVKTIDDSVFQTMFTQLYTPHSSFTYGIIPQGILGKAYEQLIAKSITVIGKTVTVEDKPDVKKAGGVFYTPSKIVEHITKKTITPLLENRSLAEAADFRVLDLSCGSGTFLLEAYAHLLAWYLNQYVADTASALENGKIRETFGRGYRLTIAERQRILVDHIRGVDIDPQAIEATKFTLLLKVLENEDDESVAVHTSSYGADGKKLQALPNIDANIQCGNALVDDDFSKQFPEIDDQSRALVRPLDLHALMREGADVVVGNPPYVRQEQLALLKNYLKRKYKDVYAGTADLYTYFIHRGIQALRPGGRLGYIVANKWMRAAYGRPLRHWLKTLEIQEIDDYGDLPVFEAATTYPCLLFLRMGVPRDTVTVANVPSLDWTQTQEALIEPHRLSLPMSALRDEGWTLAKPEVHALLAKIRAAGVPLGEYVDGKIYRGVLTGLNEAFVIDEKIRGYLISQDKKSEELIKPFLAGKDIKRYATPQVKRWLIAIPNGYTRKT